MYYVQLEGGDVYYSISASDSPEAAILNPGDRISPVSYTHLDVYKRQGLQQPRGLHDKRPLRPLVHGSTILPQISPARKYCGLIPKEKFFVACIDMPINLSLIHISP